MPTFPVLKTGAILQYPATKVVTFATSIYRFVDGSEQRYREFTAPQRRWVVRLNLLSEAEIAEFDNFYSWLQGGAGAFEFTDPWDGVIYSNCHFENDSLALQVQEEGRARTTFVIRQDVE